MLRGTLEGKYILMNELILAQAAESATHGNIATIGYGLAAIGPGNGRYAAYHHVLGYRFR